jgi:hypothetical protein
MIGVQSVKLDIDLEGRQYLKIQRSVTVTCTVVIVVVKLCVLLLLSLFGESTLVGHTISWLLYLQTYLSK